jgi:hypothetical protein
VWVLVPAEKQIPFEDDRKNGKGVLMVGSDLVFPTHRAKGAR